MFLLWQAASESAVYSAYLTIVKCNMDLMDAECSLSLQLCVNERIMFSYISQICATQCKLWNGEKKNAKKLERENLQTIRSMPDSASFSAQRELTRDICIGTSYLFCTATIWINKCRANWVKGGDLYLKKKTVLIVINAPANHRLSPMSSP